MDLADQVKWHGRRGVDVPAMPAPAAAAGLRDQMEEDISTVADAVWPHANEKIRDNLRDTDGEDGFSLFLFSLLVPTKRAQTESSLKYRDAPSLTRNELSFHNAQHLEGWNQITQH